MLTASLLVVFFSACILNFLFRRQAYKKLKNYPPGPTPFPILGSLPYIILCHPLNVVSRLKKLGHAYGKVLSFDFAGQPGIVISDVKVLKEAFGKTAVCAKPWTDVIKFIHGGKKRGIAIVHGEEWKEIRRFVVKQLIEYGMGKKGIESVIQEEVQALMKEIRKNVNRPTSSKGIFNIFAFNVLWQIVASKRFEIDDPAVTPVIDSLNGASDLHEDISMLIFFPRLVKWFPFLVNYKMINRIVKLMIEFSENLVAEKRKTFREGRLDDFTDAYLEKIQATTKSNNTNSMFYGELGYEHLAAVIRDLLLAGAETSATTLRWLFLFLAVHPETQEKVHKEIDSVLSNGRSPTLEDKARMLYTEAVILETLRKSSLTPLGIPHFTCEATTFGGYSIPKDTIVIGNLHAIHHDDDYWSGDANVFRPERWISPEGDKLIKHDAFVAFSAGKRTCPGDILARDELFLFSTTILQQFSVTWDMKGPKPSLGQKLAGEMSPLPHVLVWTERKAPSI